MVTYTDSAAHGADTVKRTMWLTVMSAVRLTGGYGCGYSYHHSCQHH